MSRLARLRRDDSGATIVEFALLLPVIFGTFLGVLQVGLSTFAYNSLRNVTAEASRYALVEYQNGREMDPEFAALDAKINEIAPGYGLETDRLDVDVTRPDVQRVDGAIELQISVTYEVRSLLPFLGQEGFYTNYTRPLFLIDEGLATI